jgi:hypothetical protein
MALTPIRLEPPLPKLFIGSASESLPLVKLLKKGLETSAHITVWSDRAVFKPLDFYVDSLLNIPPLFDFGAFLFEPDDIVASRGVLLEAPRDNVVFELGLFMSRLGLKRAFAVTPRGRVKVLSDIAGLKLLEYDSPPEADALRRKIQVKAGKAAHRKGLEQQLCDALAPAVVPLIDDIRTLMRQGIVEAKGVFADAPNVVHVGPTVMKMVRAAVEISGVAVVRHLALDMSEAWGIIANELLHDSSRSSRVEWRCLMIDPESPEIQRLASPSVSVDVAASRMGSMRDFVREYAELMKSREVTFECRLSPEAPAMHGFHIDGNALLWSMCDIRRPFDAQRASEWRLEGSNTPYWRFDATDDAVFSAHPARAFKNWFDYRWATARPAWTA